MNIKVEVIGTEVKVTRKKDGKTVFVYIDTHHHIASSEEAEKIKSDFEEDWIGAILEYNGEVQNGEVQKG